MAENAHNEMLYKLLQDFIGLWDEYYKLLNEGLANEARTQEDETRFLQLQMRVASLVQIMKESMPDDVDFDGNVHKVLTESISLDILSTESPIKINHMKSVWHDATIQGRRLQAILRSRLAA